VKKEARAVHANRGIEAAYRRKLQAMVHEMQESVLYWVKAGYRADEPTLAQDASPSQEMQKRISNLGLRWAARFESMADKIAKMFAEDMFGATDTAMMSAFRDAGWTIKFKPSKGVTDALNASVGENVSLIKSIDSQFFTQIEGAVMRGYSMGRDLKYITDQIEDIGGVSRRRAAFIARDQANKLNSACTNARRTQYGITEAIWQHSHGGKEPRPDHVAAHGTRFEIAKGCLISAEYIQPGEKINCRCTSRSVLPF
jgi:uncharacterized protein with gpF-like domain